MSKRDGSNINNTPSRRTIIKEGKKKRYFDNIKKQKTKVNSKTGRIKGLSERPQKYYKKMFTQERENAAR